MVVFYHDYSSYEGAATVPSSDAAVVAKATEGTYYQDAFYSHYKSEAARLKVPFSGYHFLKAESDPFQQAQYYHSFAGSTPCMLDVETSGTSLPTLTQTLDFVRALEGLGGRVWGVYMPRWYWSQVGGDLSLLKASGAVLISSNYTTYSDNGPGWQSYGGNTPMIWQYTSSPIDTNAFKGTAAELAAIINGNSGDMNLTDTVTFSPAVVQQFPELAAEGFGGSTNVETVLTWTAARVAHLVNEVNQLKAGGSVNPQQVADLVIAELKAKL